MFFSFMHSIVSKPFRNFHILCAIFIWCSGYSYALEMITPEEYNAYSPQQKQNYIKKLIYEEKYCEATLYLPGSMNKNTILTNMYAICLLKMREYVGAAIVMESQGDERKKDFYRICTEAYLGLGTPEKLSSLLHKAERYMPDSDIYYSLKSLVKVFAAIEAKGIFKKNSLFQEARINAEKAVKKQQGSILADAIKKSIAEKTLHSSICNGLPLSEFDCLR